MQVMDIPSRLRDYRVSFPEAGALAARLESEPNRFYVIDENVWKLHSGGALAGLDRSAMLVVPAREDRKTMDGVFEICDAVLTRSAKKNLTLVSIGGGIVQDVSGYAASTLYRGVRWVYVPTTLLAQCDSCIGGKTSLNYKRYKNLLGTFYPPHEVLISSAFVDTLSELDFYSGLGEAVKLVMMGGPRKTAEFLADLPAIQRREPAAVLRCIRTSLEVKLGYIVDDEFDTGRRNLLNLGHCLGHALESTSDFAVPHGQAVLIGMLFANEVAVKRGLLSAKKAADWERRLLVENLRVRPAPAHLELPRILDAMKKDKKRTGDGLALVMMADDFSTVRVGDLSESELAEGLRGLERVLDGAKLSQAGALR